MSQLKRIAALLMCTLILFSSHNVLADLSDAHVTPAPTVDLLPNADADTLAEAIMALHDTEEATTKSDTQPSSEGEAPTADDQENPETEQAPEVPAVPQLNLVLNGTAVDFSIPLVQQDFLTYVPLQEFVQALGCNFYWDAATNVATVSRSDDLYMTMTLGDTLFKANGRWLMLPAELSMSNGKLMVPIRGLETVFGLSLGWDADTLTVSATGGEALVHASEFYDSESLYWLSRIIQAESGNQSLEGQIAVGNVVINRVQSHLFPDNVYDVIFDNDNGVQFTPTVNGAVYNTPSTQSTIAATLALEGVNTAQDSLYFVSQQSAPRSWANQNRPYVMTIGNHVFFG